MPKRAGLHPDKALSALKVRQVTKPGKYADGNGLYLIVDKSRAKRWLLRVTIQGRRRDMGLGGVALVPLAEARELAYRYRKIARSGGDPIAERRTETNIPPTFADAAMQVHEKNRPTWSNPKHAQQWINTLQTYAFPTIGDRRVDHIQTSDVLRVLSPFWLEKPETARRVRQRINTVMDWAKAAGYRSGDNPVDGVSKGLPKQTDEPKHHDAMPFKDVPAFVARLRNVEGQPPLGHLGLEFLIHTALRTKEVLNTEWSEVNFIDRVLEKTGPHMKGKKPHSVPLSDRVIEILRHLQRLGLHDRLVFPGLKPDEPLSNMVFLETLKRMNVSIGVEC